MQYVSHAGRRGARLIRLGGAETPGCEVSHMPIEHEPLIQEDTTLAGSSYRPTGLRRRNLHPRPE